MKYRATNTKTQEVIESPFADELSDIIEYNNWNPGDWDIIKLFNCRGCKSYDEDIHIYEREDAHGITTGHWCEPCYDSSNYPYRKDKYPTIETHGYGERLDD